MVTGACYPLIYIVGVYLDLNITNTTSLLLSLRNTPTSSLETESINAGRSTSNHQSPNLGHVSFHHSAKLDEAAPPVSLLARIDREEYVLLPNSSGTVSVRSDDLDPNLHHQVRIIVPMIYDHGNGVIQFKGIWLSKHGKLSRVSGSSLDGGSDGEDTMDIEQETVDQKYSAELTDTIKIGPIHSGKNTVTSGKEDITLYERRGKILEILTDSPSSLSGMGRRYRVGGADGLLSGFMGWEYLLGEMYSIDHVAVGVDGMCLIQKCLGGTGSPVGLGDVFFRRWMSNFLLITILLLIPESGPPQSLYFDHPWMFDTYTPDLIVSSSTKCSGLADCSDPQHRYFRCRLLLSTPVPIQEEPVGTAILLRRKLRLSDQINPPARLPQTPGTPAQRTQRLPTPAQHTSIRSNLRDATSDRCPRARKSRHRRPHTSRWRHFRLLDRYLWLARYILNSLLLPLRYTFFARGIIGLVLRVIIAGLLPRRLGRSAAVSSHRARQPTGGDILARARVPLPGDRGREVPVLAAGCVHWRWVQSR